VRQALQSTLPTVPWKSAHGSGADAAVFVEISPSFAIWFVILAFSIAITSVQKQRSYLLFLMRPRRIGFCMAQKSAASEFDLSSKSKHRKEETVPATLSIWRPLLRIALIFR
jgi:hypothetical protein